MSKFICIECDGHSELWLINRIEHINMHGSDKGWMIYIYIKPNVRLFTKFGIFNTKRHMDASPIVYLFKTKQGALKQFKVIMAQLSGE